MTTRNRPTLFAILGSVSSIGYDGVDAAGELAAAAGEGVWSEPATRRTRLAAQLT